jgi:hypothetical protein
MPLWSLGSNRLNSSNRSKRFERLEQSEAVERLEPNSEKAHPWIDSLS